MESDTGQNVIYKYDPQADVWTSLGELPAVDDTKKGRYYPSASVINDKAYIGVGCQVIDGENLSDFYEYTLK